jgi:hypothetical protein
VIELDAVSKRYGDTLAALVGMLLILPVLAVFVAYAVVSLVIGALLLPSATRSNADWAAAPLDR